MSINIIRYRIKENTYWGVVHQDNIFPIDGEYTSLADFLMNGKSIAKRIAQQPVGNNLKMSEVQLLSPVTSPCSIVCQGTNYADHRAEVGAKPQEADFNLLFSKATSSLTGANAEIMRPSGVQLLDYELELGLVIGHDIEKSIEINQNNLANYIAGVVMVNDISARDIQIPQEQWFKGKSFRNFCPVGPYLCLLEDEEIFQLAHLELILKVNGEVRQKTNTGKMIYGPAETLTELSSIMNLHPGDLLLTGTPGGVALQAPGIFVQKMASLLFSNRKKMQIFVKKQLKNNRYLKNGDVIHSSIQSKDGSINLGTQALTIVGSNHNIGSDPFLRSLLGVLVPTANHTTEQNFNVLMQKRSPALQKQLKAFSGVIRYACFLRYLKTFEKLKLIQQKAVLSFFESSLSSTMRLGFWGLRSMVLLAHYGSLDHGKKIGFTGPTLKYFPNFNENPENPFTVPALKLSGHKYSKHQLEFDIVIIGSGAGGGVVAERLIPLAREGLRIAVLESGPHYAPQEYFNQQELKMSRLFWEDGGLINKEGTLTLATARMLGGSTAVYTGVSFDLPESVFNNWQMDMSYAEFQLRLQKQRNKFNVHTLPPERINRNNLLFKEGARNCGMNVVDLEISTQDCKGSGFCNLGCVNNAKMSTLNVQLPAAQRAGIELLANCHVNSIQEGLINARIFQAPQGTKRNHYEVGDYEIRAKQIVVAGGCYGTNALLLRSGLQPGGKSPGHFLTMHPSLTVYGRHPDQIDGFQNFPKAYYVDDFSNSEDHIIETAFYYPGVTAKNIEHWGEEHMRRMNSYSKLMCIIILNHDKALRKNRMFWNGKQPVIDYKISQATLTSLCHGQIRAAEVFFAAGCNEVYVPFAKGGIVRSENKNRIQDLISVKHYLSQRTVFASAHPQGGCAIGAEGSGSICDLQGRLRGFKNIYVADASLFPSSSHVNPYLTVMALADVVSDAVIADSKS